MPEMASLLNDPLYAYLLRQNLHNQTHLRYKGNEFPSHISKWSEKNYRHEKAIGDFQCANILDNMFGPTPIPTLVTLACKMSSGMPRSIGSLNGPFTHIWWSRTSPIELVQYPTATNVIVQFQIDQRRFMDRRALTVIFDVRNWKIWKKNHKILFWRMRKHGSYTDYHV